MVRRVNSIDGDAESGISDAWEQAFQLAKEIATFAPDSYALDEDLLRVITAREFDVDSALREWIPRAD